MKASREVLTAADSHKLNCYTVTPAGDAISFDQGRQGFALMEAAKLKQTLLDTNSAILALRADLDKVAVMSFCWGSGLAFNTWERS